MRLQVESMLFAEKLFSKLDQVYAVPLGIQIAPEHGSNFLFHGMTMLRGPPTKAALQIVIDIADEDGSHWGSHTPQDVRYQ